MFFMLLQPILRFFINFYIKNAFFSSMNYELRITNYELKQCNE